jgi:hypothetical protein
VYLYYLLSEAPLVENEDDWEKLLPAQLDTDTVTAC